MYSTAICGSLGGEEWRNQAWGKAREVWEIGLTGRTADEAKTLFAFHRVVARGRENSFRFQSPLPGESTGNNELLGIGDGINRVFQLKKWYGYGGVSASRLITKPIIGSISCTVGGVPVNIHAFSTNTRYGVLTLNVAPGVNAEVRSSFSFEIPVRFDLDTLPLEQVDTDEFQLGSIKLWETRELV